MDGTLFPGALGMELITHLAERGLSDVRLVEQIRLTTRRYVAGELDFNSASSTVYRAYAASLEGRARHRVQQVARECWAAVRDQLFFFSRQLVADLARLGVHTMLISGSPDEIVQVAALDLGIPAARGLVARTRAGRYTGELIGTPGAPGGKLAAIAELTHNDPDPVECAFAIGNSMTDAEVLHHSTRSVAFEPDADLAALAEASGWPLADRTSLPAVLKTVLPSLAS
jgi:phosphoserine phosphatase